MLKAGFYKFSQEVITNSKYPSNVREMINEKNKPDETKLYNFFTILTLILQYFITILRKPASKTRVM